MLIGIDPGFVRAGFAIVNEQTPNSEVIELGVLQQKSSVEITTRVGKFYDFFLEKIIEHKIKYIALEVPFLGKNPQNFLKLGYLRGVVKLLSYQHCCTLLEFSPREIKSAVTGYGHADKEQVANSLKFYFPFLKEVDSKELCSDITDALAIAFFGSMKVGAAVPNNKISL